MRAWHKISLAALGIGLITASVLIAQFFISPKAITTASPEVASSTSAEPAPPVATASTKPAEPSVSHEIVAAEYVPPKPPPPPKPTNTNIYAGSAPGYDVSYPQCSGGLPSLATFAILGVTGGKAFTHSSCLSSQFSWAKRGTVAPSLYINLNFPSGSSVGRGLNGPAGNCLDADLSCQTYNYGYNAAGDAKSYADSVWVGSSVWWLDIELFNTWYTDATLNARVVQGAIDYFHNHGITVGIYSVPRFWASIVEGYRPGVPEWIAGGARAPDTAASFCGVSFTGGPVWLSQYVPASLDLNLSCQ